ncbi:MAG: hypothetical protein M1812_007353 [Candelaria pacifica]|nr:MAG: hypothetical protein M1812_007353 [Candelaria pacifica]
MPSATISEIESTMQEASLHTINLKALFNHDSAESDKLFDAAKTCGFFYLDMRDPDLTYILKMADEVFDLSRCVFALPEEEKAKFDVDGLGDWLGKMKLNGYKPIARNFGGIEGHHDGFESYALPKDGMLGFSNASNFARPQVISDVLPMLKHFTTAMLDITTALLTSLSKSLELPEHSRLENYHRATHASPDLLRLLKYASQPFSERGAPQTPHTDLGSLTILFTSQPGLQVLPPGADEWAYVRPLAGHAIINLGDALMLMTGGLLHSCLHRVAPLPGKRMTERYSFAYLQRPEDWAPMRRVKGMEGVMETEEVGGGVVGEEADCTSGEWLKKKFGMLRLETHQDEKDWVLMGGHGGHLG